jgi:DHA3 family macrolide efflux protein-like MFS transporter
MRKEFDYEHWQRPFLTIWGGQVFSILGSNLVNFALVWWLTTKTGSAAVLATSTIVLYLPRIFLGPFIGALVDRWNRRLIMIVADGFVASGVLVLAYLFWRGSIQIWHVYVIMAMRSLGGTFHFPAMYSSTSLMVPEKHLSRVAGLNQIIDGGMSVIGPPLGALLLGLFPIYGVLAVDIITALLAILPLLFTFIPQPESTKAGEMITPRSLLGDIKAGFIYIFSWKGMAILLALSIIANFLFAPIGSFLPLLVTQYFAGDVWHYSSVEAIFGIGMVSGGLLLSVWGGFKRRVVSILAGFIGMGAGMLLVGFAPQAAFGMAVVGMFFSGFANTFSNGVAYALIQSVIDPAMQGRMFTTIMSVNSVMSPLALAIATPLVESYGVHFWYVLAPALIVLCGSVACLIPAVVKIEDQIPQLDKSKIAVQSSAVTGGD